MFAPAGLWLLGASLAGVLPPAWADALLPPMTGQATDFAPRRAGVEVGAAWRMDVTNEGVYRITARVLAEAGVPVSNLVGASLRLYCRTQEIALAVSAEGAWGEGDYLLFYGYGYEGAYTTTNVYWLGFGGAGLRMQTRSVAPSASAPVMGSYPKTVTYQAKTWFQDTYRPDDAALDHWFAAALRQQETTTVTLVTDAPVAGGTASVSVVLYGKSSVDTVNPDHCTQVQLNENGSASLYFDGQNGYTGWLGVAAGLLQTTNTLTLTQSLLSGVAADYAYLKSCALTYRRRLLAEGASLVFDGQSGTNTYGVTALPAGSELLVWDVTAPNHPVRLTDAERGTDVSGATVQFTDGVTGVPRYAVYHASGVRDIAASAIRPARFRGLAETNQQADYIVICPYAFRQPVYRLLQRRYQQGLNVAVAPITDIYDEFGYGVVEAEALKQFIGYVYHHWRSPAPRFVLLAGSGTYDPRHYLYASDEIIPVHLGPTAYKWTALDGWFAQVAGDDAVPDVALGRVPVVTADELTTVVDKIIAFEEVSATDAWRRTILLVADQYDETYAYDFQAVSDRLRVYAESGGFRSTSVYGGDTAAASAIVSAINGGTFLVNYLGHGASDQWSDNDIFNSQAVSTLTNTRYPLFVMLTCQNGAFHSPVATNLVSALLTRSGAGAVGCVAASGLSSYQGSEDMGAGFYQALIGNRVRYLGEAMAAGYAELAASDADASELSLYTLFGDPATEVNP